MTTLLRALKQQAASLNDTRIRAHLVELRGELEQTLKTERSEDAARELANAERTVRESHQRQEREGQLRYSNWVE